MRGFLYQCGRKFRFAELSETMNVSALCAAHSLSIETVCFNRSKLKAPSPDEAFYFQISILSLFSQQDISRCHFKWCNRYAEYLFRFLFAIDFAIAKSVLDVSLYLLQFWEDYGFISAGIYPSAPFIEPIFLCYADPIPPCHRFWSAYPSYVHGSRPAAVRLVMNLFGLLPFTYIRELYINFRNASLLGG